MSITLEQLREELKKHGVKFHHSMKEPKLAQLLIEKYKENGLEINDELVVLAQNKKDEDDDDNKQGETKIYTFVQNVKHDGTLYKKGESHELPDELAETFKSIKVI